MGRTYGIVQGKAVPKAKLKYVRKQILPKRAVHTPPCMQFALPQGVTAPLAGQMFFRSTLFGAFGASKRWLAQNADGSPKALTTADFYKVKAIMSGCNTAGKLLQVDMGTKSDTFHKCRLAQ